MYTTYDLHGLVKISVSLDIHRNAGNAVKEQLGSLEPTSGSMAQAELRLEPYSAVGKTRISRFGGPALLRGERLIDIPGQEIGVGFGDKQITLYLGVKGTPLNPWLQLLLVPQGLTMIHAAAVERDGGVLLLPAFGGAGKTLSVGLLVKNYGYRFLGDDIVLLRLDGAVFSFPRPLFFYEYHLDVFGDYFRHRKATLARHRVFAKLKRKAVRGFPSKGLAKRVLRSIGVEGYVRRVVSTHDYYAAARAQDVFPEGSIGNSGTLRRVIMLQRFNGAELEEQPVNQDDLVARMFGILHNEWTAEWPAIVAAGAHGLVNLAGYYRGVEEIMGSALNGTSMSSLLIPEHCKPGDFVPKLLEHGEI